MDNWLEIFIIISLFFMIFGYIEWLDQKQKGVKKLKFKINFAYVITDRVLHATDYIDANSKEQATRVIKNHLEKSKFLELESGLVAVSTIKEVEIKEEK